MYPTDIFIIYVGKFLFRNNIENYYGIHYTQIFFYINLDYSGFSFLATISYKQLRKFTKNSSAPILSYVFCML